MPPEFDPLPIRHNVAAEEKPARNQIRFISPLSADIRGEWDNSIQKFCLIADIVTYLVGVAEKEPSDFLVGTTEFFAKSHVLKRVYEDEEHPFGWMQDGVFELFEREGRLYRWQIEERPADVTEELP